ncbi:peptidoglycan editing factor PgeF [Neobacillus sp. CF12]|uniref:peptidoglycan editing factor PgeF n=1 Tax=Neobacillus sp. CF12 TaxID=3055864 RepID=UPI0025A0D304|nr:peptidoglycan editing factor PgeF [Neobacillus sp. CF12]MDM5328022.1 peptidoglycan editing factor PgeF [Neobacillus sp. CF12]
MEPFINEDQSYFSIKNWMDQFPGLVAGITTKNGGNSTGFFDNLNMGFHVGDLKETVCSNRDKLANLLQFPLKHWVGAEQTHDTLIRKVNRTDRGHGSNSYDNAFKGTDGFYTNEEGILLTLCYADCVPLFFIAPKHRMIGAAHAGWKGTVNEIAREMVVKWEGEGIAPNQIFVAIGPSICEKCYIVNDYVINFVENTLVDVEKKPYNLIQEGQYTLDLRKMNKMILLNAGVPEKNIHISKLCSSCDHSIFFSHRRDQGKTGRMLSFIGWKETSE